eukprot:GILK01003130.1.p1 GENE.GILK01003130.1~~GILK01003130.1.p1  ORF type:complete len:551 (+),score=105.36 GILK01003130.1:45-1655(+)
MESEYVDEEDDQAASPSTEVATTDSEDIKSESRSPASSSSDVSGAVARLAGTSISEQQSIVDSIKESKRLDMLLQDKKASFQALQAWEEHRRNQCSSQRDLLDVLFLSIQARFNSARELHGSIVRYLKDRAHVELSYSKAMAESRKHLPRMDKDEKGIQAAGTLREGLASLSSLHERIAVEHADFSAEITKEFLGNGVSAMAAEYSKHADTFIDKTVSLVKDMESASTKCRKNFSAHETFCRDLDALALANKQMKTDLWLSERKFVKSAVEVVRQHKVYSDHMLNLLAELRRLEEWRITNVQTIMSRFLERSEALYQHMSGTHLPEAVRGLTKINAAVEAKLLSDPDNLLRKPSTPNQPPAPAPSAMLQTVVNAVIAAAPSSRLVTREGELERQTGKVLKSWKTSSFVLTKDRYLHCFKAASDAEPTWSVNLSDCTFQFEPLVGETAISIVEEKKGGPFNMFNKKRRFILRAPTQEQMVDWLVYLKSPVATESPRPLSIDSTNDSAAVVSPPARSQSMAPALEAATQPTKRAASTL